MKTIRKKDSRRWAREKGIDASRRYPNSGLLVYTGMPDYGRFWEVPEKPFLLPELLSAMLDLMGDWQSCYVRKRSEIWFCDTGQQNPADQVHAQILNGIRVQAGKADVLEFDRTEQPQLLTVLFASLVFGVCVSDDPQVFPDHGRYILQTDHHDTVDMDFQHKKDIEPFVKGMADAGYPLPEDVPDATFKIPEWMRNLWVKHD